VGCPAERKAVKPVEPERLVVPEVAPFDVATCGKRLLSIGGSATPQLLGAYLTAALPWISECLVDGRHRGPAPKTHVVVEATVAEQGPSFVVSGENITPTGASCIQEALGRLGGLPSLPPKSIPVKGRLERTFDRAKDLGISHGDSAAQELAGEIRLSLPLWCDCFAAWQERAPRAQPVEVAVTPGTPAHVRGDLELTNDNASDEVAACLARKVGAMEASSYRGPALRFTYPLQFIHSGVAEPLMGSQPRLQLMQAQAVQLQRAAAVAARKTQRQLEASELDAIPRRKHGRRRVANPQVKDQCVELIKMDDTALRALSDELEALEQTLSLAGELKAREPAWVEAEKSTQQSLTQAQADYKQMKSLRAADVTTCSKER
jgi:hypothetical protein